MTRIAVFVGTRGRGSNLRSIVAACEDREVPAQVALVVGTTDEAGAVVWAMEHGLPVAIVEPGEGYGERIMRALGSASVQWVCLAGYTRLLPAEVLAAYPGRILNVHPALLPKFGGKGMYGRRVHEAVLDAGERESGCSVHIVTERYDEGPVVLQLSCPVHQGDTPETLAARVLELEHRAYPAALKQLLT